MTYIIETTERFDKDFKKLDRYTQRMIKSWIVKNLIDCSDPRQHGKGLVGNKSGQWRYRIGDYRLICKINDYLLSNLAAFIILKADKIRKKKLYVLFILSPMLRPKRYDDNFLYQYRLRY